ncbi:unnamed protein product [marine sediment metagenome]|uniref:Homing endonuclease LAGLIDADG domain-containing protein n=1 Tax=marine sediment metagenome TaxID=412755 RepID=X0Y2A7_9ZZZZ
MYYKGELKKYITVGLIFGCVPMWQELKDNGLYGSKSERKEIPQVIKDLVLAARKKKGDQWYETSEGKTALAWLLGIFDADGGYRGGRSGLIYSSSEQLLEDLKELFDIKNGVNEAVKPGTVKFAFDRAYISKGFYSITLGPDLYEEIINSFKGGLKRKRPLGFSI